ncbi:hypothetical protein [Desulfosporosinus sp. OT]|nr:hypothetical protein [Desulfosporosinus sp. OT]
MTQSNSHVTKHAMTSQLKLSRGIASIPSVGGKMFRRTSESAGSIH